MVTKQKEEAKKKLKLTPRERSIFNQGQELGHKRGSAKGYATGEESGYKKGYSNGEKEGYDAGERAGHKKGFTTGKENGHVEGEKLGYKKGSDHTYPLAFHEGKTTGKKELIATVEKKLAEVAGYKDPLKWRDEATIPAWWIAVLVDNYEGTFVVHSSARDETIEELTPEPPEESEP